MFPPLCFRAVMQLNNQPQNINSTSQEVVGVTLDKNKAGVTAKVDINSTVKFHLFFDGATAQLELTGSDFTTFSFAVTQQININNVTLLLLGR